MAVLINSLIEEYKYIVNDLADPRTNEWYFIGTPWPVLGIVTFYLYFIQTLGPSIMANRPPMKLDRIMQLYNVFQIIANAYIFYKASVLGWLNSYSWSCEPVDYSFNSHAIKVAGTVWLYFLIKILDLIDTIFFVLRKKDNQISFLHVYHHAGMVIVAWTGTKYLAGGHGTFVGWVNSLVHTVMYTHYLVMSLKIWKPWWKKYITQMQLLQFVILFFHFSQLIWVDCGFPRWPALLFIPQNLFMIILFSDFYYKTYIKKPKLVHERQNIETNAEASNGKPKSQ